MPDNNQISMSMNIAYSGQTRAKLEADLTPLVKELVMEDIESSAQLFEKKAGHHVYSHVQVYKTEHTVDGEAVLVLLGCEVERGATKTSFACHIGSEKHVRAMEAKCRDVMKERAKMDTRSLILQIDEEPTAS
jgi:hypothetical protein